MGLARRLKTDPSRRRGFWVGRTDARRASGNRLSRIAPAAAVPFRLTAPARAAAQTEPTAKAESLRGIHSVMGVTGCRQADADNWPV
jgi:hypothetical protein